MATTEITPPAAIRPPRAADAGPRALPRWPLFLVAAPAAVAVWSGWVGLGALCGFGIVHPLPGIADGFRLDTAITLPVGVEAYGAYALGAWLTPGTAPAARTFARRSALGALALGMTGQVIYHLLAAAHAHAAPWPVVMLVSCLPVLTLGFGGALTHLLRTGHPAGHTTATTADSTPDTPRTRTRTPGRTARADTTAAKIARVRAAHPDMTAAGIAARLKISDRTVRRHLSARTTTAPPLPVAG
jgi:hypothetical protein